MSYFLPPIDSWSDWSALFNDEQRWKPVIDAICTSRGIRYRRIAIPRSNTNAVFLLDRRLILKIYSPFWSDFNVEGKLIELLKTNQAIPVPKVVAAGSFQDRITWNYVLMEFAAGQTLDAVKSIVARDDLLAISRQVGILVRDLHETDVQSLDGLDTGESWDALVHRRRRDALAELAQWQLIGPRVAQSLADTLDHVLADDRGRQRTLVHGDLGSDHILLNKINGDWTVTCLIDFGDAKIGVSDYEWMPLWLGLFDRDIGAMRAFLEAYDPRLLADNELPRRLMAWTLLHDFGADAVAERLRESNVPTPVESVAELRRILWPALTTLCGTW
ncbi:MAG: aminoglycoside phosphotransferase family protein [Chloroflexi bacterium]|nr:aminoglycoside phosphotransferase family protein [Chloroflexota bacterium]MCY3956846.1 aminoglycoside phosphotransferase family protein [Chloroflexota bacterium]